MIFSELAKQNRVIVDKESMTGLEYCNEIITTLCNTKVSSEDAVAFTAVLRELKIPANITSRYVDVNPTSFEIIIPNLQFLKVY